MVALRFIALAVLAMAGLAFYARSTAPEGSPAFLRPMVCVLNPASPGPGPASLETARKALREHRFDEAYQEFREAAPALQEEPLSLLTDALDRMGPDDRRDGARWLAGWLGRGEAEADFPDRACAAGVYVSEFFSPERAIAALEPVVARHPREVMPRLGLATVLLHHAGSARLVPGERRVLLRRALVLLDEAEALAAPGVERSRARLLRVDFLAFSGRSREALRLYEQMKDAGETDFGYRDLAEREFEAGILCLRLHDPEEAARYLEQALAAQDRLDPDDGERLTPPAAMALASRYAFLGVPPTRGEIRHLEETVRHLTERGQRPTVTSGPLLGLPAEVGLLETGSPADLEALIGRMEGIEVTYGPSASLPPCLSLMTHYRPVAVAVSQVVRGDALRRLGRGAEAREQFLRASREFPHLPALEARRDGPGGPAVQAGPPPSRG